VETAAWVVAFATIVLFFAGCSEQPNYAKDACHAELGIWHAADAYGSDAWCDFAR